MTRIYLRKNDTTKNEKLPYFTLVIPPEEGVQDQEWKEIGALWKAKSGVGYSGFLTEGVVVDTTNMKRFEPKKKDEPKD